MSVFVLIIIFNNFQLHRTKAFQYINLKNCWSSVGLSESTLRPSLEVRAATIWVPHLFMKERTFPSKVPNPLCNPTDSQGTHIGYGASGPPKCKV